MCRSSRERPFRMLGDDFFPCEAALGAGLLTNRAPLEPLRGKFTVFSNVDNRASCGHSFTHTVLSCDGTLPDSKHAVAGRTKLL